MSELNNFYNSILNINNKNQKEEIIRIVLEERKDLSNHVNQLDGFCKYLANQIACRINREISGVHTYEIDLNDLVSVDHTILIAEYMSDFQMKRLLIDPSISQFVKKANTQLVKLNKWPGDEIDKNILFDLIKYGVVEVDNLSFQNYLDSFTELNIKIDLEDYLLQNKIGKKL